MAITRSQQARQMLKEAGFVVQDGFKNYIKNSESVTVPKEFKSRENATPTKLAYITKDEAKMLKKMKKGTPHKGPKGIPSYDDFDADTGTFRSGAAMSAAETGAKTERQRADLRQAGVSPEEARDIRLAAIASGAGQRVNPGFFDSRNVIPRADVLAAKKAFPKAFARTRGGGLLGFLTSGGILGNLIRGLGRRFGLGKKFNEPTYDMRQFSDLGLLTDRVNPTFQNDLGNQFLEQLAEEKDENKIPIVIDDDMSLIPRKNLNDYEGVTPFQRNIIEDTQDQADDLFLKGAMADASTDNEELLKKLLNPDLNVEEFIDKKKESEDRQQELLREILGTQNVADGGIIGGGIMDAAGRQNYFLGKLVKKATRAVKKIVKSPVGRLGLGALALKLGGGFAQGSPLMNFLFKKGTLGSGLTGKGMLALGGALSAAPLLFQEEEEQPSGFTGSPGGNIDPRAYTDPFGVLYGAFKAEGGSMKDEPVAKRTMPLLDMGGQEMDLRAEGGFVPIGRMEKADDVPARLSKNEFVFTANAVRNAGDGDVDKGAEVMYNMMKNLEAGGDVSEESQGLEGARNMFQTSKRLEEIL